MLLRVAAIAALAVLAAGCGGGGGKGTTTSALPPGCTAPDAERIVTSFLAKPEFAPVGFFEVYVSEESDGRQFVAQTPEAALARARARLRLGERDRLLSLQVAPVDVNAVDISFTITRSAPDFRRRGIHARIANGTGRLDCVHGKVAGWIQKGP